MDSRKDQRSMRTYWDERARENALWYVDTSLDFDHPNLERFFDTGRRIVSEALDASPVPLPGARLAVEIGCGLGRICLALAERFEHVVGVDVSPEMVERARRLAPHPRIAFHIGDGSTLDEVNDGSADLVLSFTVFQHIPRVAVIDGYIRESTRVLRPGGLLVFQWNNIAGAARWALRREALSLLQRTGLRRERYRRHAPQFLGSRVPLRRIRRSLEREGMELRATSGLGTLFAWAWAVRTP
jgi:SAM-dependent methyltransferase